MSVTKPVKRGCGYREAGGVYIECGLSKGGKPIEFFLIDPPHCLDLDAMGISDIGVHPVKDKHGTWHVFNVVGQKYWPNVADYVEEVRHFGLSARVQRSFPFELLTPKSRIVSVHRKAFNLEADRYLDAISEEFRLARTMKRTDIEPVYRCPKGLEEHPYPPVGGAAYNCAGLWWEDVTNADLVLDPEVPPRTVIREMPSFSYMARKRPIDKKPEYVPAAFMSLPIQNLSVIADPVGNRHEQSMALVQKAELPWSLDQA